MKLLLLGAEVVNAGDGEPGDEDDPGLVYVDLMEPLLTESVMESLNVLIFLRLAEVPEVVVLHFKY